MNIEAYGLEAIGWDWSGLQIQNPENLRDFELDYPQEAGIFILYAISSCEPIIVASGPELGDDEVFVKHIIKKFS